MRSKPFRSKVIVLLEKSMSGASVPPGNSASCRLPGGRGIGGDTRLTEPVTGAGRTEINEQPRARLAGLFPARRAMLVGQSNPTPKDCRFQISGKQYILSLNQNQLDEVKKYLTETEYQTIIEQNICLELKDDSPEDKLLGLQVDMDYNK